ncbi:MAG: hypothetical protein KA171_24110 [Reyranella sp.]|nr:hypothetical protein [Reyranella sp.]
MAAKAGIGARMAPLIDKYGFDVDDAAAAGTRIAATLHGLATQLRAQQARGASYFVGDALSCVDIYWTSVMNMLLPLPAAQCPIRESSRPAFTATDPQIVAALDTILVEHRDRIFKAHFRDPMEF